MYMGRTYAIMRANDAAAHTSVKTFFDVTKARTIMAKVETVYFEQRVSAARGTDSLAADIMRHLHARQSLGSEIIVCDHPIAMLSACRKQWLKLSRMVQRQRAGTLNADKVMKFTHAISRMQRMRFTCKLTCDFPDADVYCLTPSQAAALPFRPASVYLTTTPDKPWIAFAGGHMPTNSLIVDYMHVTDWQKLFGMQPKQALEDALARSWKNIATFLEQHNITPTALHDNRSQDIEAMDDALDILLGIAQPFLKVANNFHAALAIARPLKISKGMRLQYDAVTLLAHRVQALTAGGFSQRFLETYEEDDTYFLLYSPDAAHSSNFAELLAHHARAGRERLAAALLRYDSRQRSAILDVL